MTNSIQIQVFVSYLHDVEQEKNIVEEVSHRVNDRLVSETDCDVQYVIKEWKKLLAEFGQNPQEYINTQIGTYDIYIGIWWKYFGSKTGLIDERTGEEFQSGASQEFTIAFQNWKESDVPKIYLFFKEKKINIPDEDESEQLSKVARFKKEQMQNGLVHPFEETEEFRDKITDILYTKAINICLEDKVIQKENVISGFEDKEKESFDIPKYDFPEIHLNRSILHFSTIKDKRKSFIYEMKRKKLSKLIFNEKRIVLLGEAGSGKTTELQNLAAELSQDDSPFIPIFQKLNTYTSDQTLENYLPEYWRKIPKDLLVIIWDGLDEIPPEDFNKVIRQLISFSEKHPNIRIVISSRTNFYDLPTNFSEGTLSGYEPYFLTSFNENDIKKYYSKNYNEKEAEEFIEQIYKNELSDLTSRPYFVMLLADIFAREGNLGLNRSELYEDFLSQRIELDEKHFSRTYEIREKKQEIIKLLEKVALSMEIMAQNYVDETELLQIVSSAEFKTLKYCTAFTKNKGEERKWKFEHNNIQEYLAARTLSKQRYHNIKQFITFEPDHKKLNPSWLNTLSFLFSLLKPSDELFEQLLEWLLKNEQEVIVKFERDKISSAIRNKLFKEIFNHYKTHDVWINSNKFSEMELAKFAQSQENLDFLINEIQDKQNTRTIKLNAIHLVGHFDYEKFKANKRQRVEKLLLSQAEANSEDPYYVFSSINALNHAQFHDRKLIEKVMEVLRERKNQYIRASIYSLLLDSDHLDDYVDYLIEGKKLLNKSELQGSEDRGSTSLMDESFNLNKCLKSIQNPKGLEALYDQISKERYFNFGFDSDKILNAIIDNSIKAYRSNGNSLFESFLQWYVETVNNYRNQWVNKQLRFFEETDTKGKAFRSLWNREGELDQDKLTPLAYLITEGSLEFVLDEYENHECTNDDVKNLYQTMRRVGNNLQTDFRELINKETSIHIQEPEPRIDYQELRENKKQRDFDLLFKEDGLKKNIIKIFDEEDKDALTEDDLFEMRKTERGMTELGDIYPHPSLKLLRNFAGKNEAVEQDSILQWFEEKQDVEWYRISMIYEYLSRNEGIEVNDNQREWIKTWCEENVTEVDFKEAIKGKEGGGNISIIAVYLWFFLRRFDFKYSKEVMLDMLSFDYMDNHSWVGIEYLEDKLDKQDIENRIIRNLKEGIQVHQVLLNHIQYAVEHKLDKVYPIIFDEILNAKREEYDRKEIINLYFEETKEYKVIKELLPKADSLIRWKLVELLYENEEHEFLEEYLISMLDSNLGDEEKRNAAEYLVKMENLEGLSYYVNWLKDEKPFDYDYVKTNCLNNLIKIDALSYLIELLELSYEIDERLDRMNSLKNNVLSAIKRIGLDSKENFKEVRSSLENFMEEHKDTKNVKYLLHTIERLEQQFYMNKAQSYSIDQVKEKLKLIRQIK